MIVCSLAALLLLTRHLHGCADGMLKIMYKRGRDSGAFHRTPGAPDNHKIRIAFFVRAEFFYGTGGGGVVGDLTALL